MYEPWRFWANLESIELQNQLCGDDDDIYEEDEDQLSDDEHQKDKKDDGSPPTIINHQPISDSGIHTDHQDSPPPMPQANPSLDPVIDLDAPHPSQPPPPYDASDQSESGRASD